MQHAHLGRTGLQVSRLCLGTMTFGLQCDEETSIAIIDRAAEGGVTFLDTADVYPARRRPHDRRPHRGDRRSVAARASASSSSSRRSASARWARAAGTWATAVATSWTPSMPRCAALADRLHRPLPAALQRPEHADRRDARRARRPRARGQGALRRLLELPRVPTRARVRPQRGARLRAVRFACSRATTCCSASSSARCSRSASTRASASSRTTRSRAACSPASTTGRSRPVEGTRFTLGTAGAMYQDRYWHEQRVRHRRAAGEASPSRPGCRSPTLAVAWVLAHPAITSPIIGASRPDQLDATLAAVETRPRRRPRRAPERADRALPPRRRAPLNRRFATIRPVSGRDCRYGRELHPPADAGAGVGRRPGPSA